jgi:phospholipid/cholesterol/gamma-HCH transport system ATP-binding protein
VVLPLRERTDKSPEECDRIAREKLAMVDLDDVFKEYPNELSGGMQKRAALARAIVMEPEIILYDEPTSGLDPVTARTIDRLIQSLCKNLGVTSVVVTHDLHSALAIGSRIAMLDEGLVVELATPADFVKSHKPEVVRFLESQYITTRGAWERA